MSKTEFKLDTIELWEEYFYCVYGIGEQRLQYVYDEKTCENREEFTEYINSNIEDLGLFAVGYDDGCYSTHHYTIVETEIYQVLNCCGIVELKGVDMNFPQSWSENLKYSFAHDWLKYQLWLTRECMIISIIADNPIYKYLETVLDGLGYNSVKFEHPNTKSI